MAEDLEVKLTINEEYAKRYEQKKRAEELSKRETMHFSAICTKRDIAWFMCKLRTLI